MPLCGTVGLQTQNGSSTSRAGLRVPVSVGLPAHTPWASLHLGWSAASLRVQPSWRPLLLTAAAPGLGVPAQPVLGLLGWLNHLRAGRFRAWMTCVRHVRGECHHLHNCSEFFCLIRDVTRKPWFGICGLVSASSHLKRTIQISTVSGQYVSGRGHICDVEQCAGSISEV